MNEQAKLLGSSRRGAPRGRLLGILLTMCLLLMLLPSVALAASDVTDPGGTNGYSFTAVDGALTITSNAGTTAWRDNQSIVGIKRTDYTVVKSVTFSADVTDIGASAFKECSGLTSLTIPDTVKTIGQSAFNGCTKLAGAMPALTNVTSIGNYAFYGCASLTGTLTIPAGVTDIKQYVFSGCTGLTALIIPDTVKTIDIGAFNGCIGLTAAMPALTNVTIIGDSAFDGCTNLTGTLDMPKVTNIGSLAFGRCGKLTGQLNLPSVTSIGSSAFEGCINLTGTLAMPKVESIGNRAFWECGKLTGQLNLPATLTTIGPSAFHKCVGLNGTLTIPAGITTISNYAFNDCKGLTELIIPAGATTIDLGAFNGCAGLTTLTLPASITTIGNDAFKGCIKLAGLPALPNVATIGDNAFNSCTGLTGAMPALPNVKTIGDSAFWECSGLTGQLTIPLVTTISKNAFYYCTGLTGALTIPGTVTIIDSFAFQGCAGLTGLTIETGVTTIGVNTFKDCSGLLGTLTLPNSVTTIKGSAFQGCAKLTTLTLPASITTIGDSAFNGCVNLTGTLTALPNVTTIGTNAFNGCTTLTGTLDLPEVTTIGESAFYKCAKLTGLSALPKVKTIGDSAFSGCKTLTGQLDFPLVTTIGNGAFQGCAKLTGGLTIPGAVTIIGSNAFDECTGLNGALTISSGITDIGTSAFKFCEGLTSLTIPATVTFIGDLAFTGCAKLPAIDLPASVATIGRSAFAGCAKLATITVAAGNQNFMAADNVLYNRNQTTLLLAAPAGVTGVLNIPASVTEIGERAFENCSKLTSAVFTTATAPTLGGNVFNGLNNPPFSITIPATQTGYREGTWDTWKGLLAKSAISGTATITGTPQVGATLSLNYSSLVGGAPGIAKWHYNSTQSTEGSTQFGTGTSVNLINATAGKYIYVIVPANAATHSGSYTTAFMGPVAKAAAPAAPAVSFSFSGTDKNKLQGATTDMEYTLAGNDTWTPCTTNMTLNVADISAANGIKVRLKETAGAQAGQVQTITITQPNAPSGLAAVDANGAANDGQITGTTTALEYSTTVDFASATTCTASPTTGLAPATYYVRVKAADTAMASNAVTLTIAVSKAEVVIPTADSKVYNGSNQTSVLATNADYTVTANAGGTDVGEYDVVLTLVNSTTHQWADKTITDKTLKFKITKATNAINTLTLAGWTYGGTASTPAAGATFGTATFSYDTAENGTYALPQPSDAGTYWVKATVEGTANYDKVVRTLSFTIAKAAAQELTAAPSINYTREFIATTTAMEYKVGLGNWTACAADMPAMDFGWNYTAINVSFRTAASDANHEAGKTVQTLNIPGRTNPPTPNSFTVTPPTTNVSTDGVLNNVDTTMQYGINNGSWTDCTGTSISGLKDGDICYIRYKATGTAFAGLTTQIEIKSKTDVTSSITFANGEATYNGAGQACKQATSTDSSGGTFTYTYTTTNGALDSKNLPKGAGTYTVTAKYESDTATGSKQATFTIKPLAVTLSGLTAPAKIYDGTTDATIDGTAVIEGKITADTVTVTAGTATFANKNVGTAKPITCTGYALDGVDKGNYTLTAQPTGLTANITAKTLTIGQGDVAVTKAYDGTTAAGKLTGTLTFDKVATDNLTITTTPSVYGDVKAGTNKTVTLTLTLDGTDKGNYTLPTATYTLTTAEITKVNWTKISAAGAAKYGNSGEVDLNSLLAEGGTFGSPTIPTNAAYFNGTPTVNAGILAFTFADVEANKHNSVAVIVPVTGATNHNNYQITAILTINDKDAQTNFAFDNAPTTTTYGAGKFNVTTKGVLDAAVISYESSSPTVASIDSATGEVTVRTVGKTTIKATAAATKNYAATTLTYELTVEAKAITAPAADTKEFIYTGAEQTYTLATDAAYNIRNEKQSDANETGHTITVALADKANTCWADDKSTTDKTYNFIIKKATITIAAKNKSAQVGDKLPTLGTVLDTDYTVSGLVAGQTLGGTVTLAYDPATPDMNKAGKATINVSGATAPNGNYNAIVYTPATLTISDRPASGGGSYTPPLVTEIRTGGSSTSDNLDRLVAGKKTLSVLGENGANLVFDTTALKGINDKTSGNIQIEVKDVSKNYSATHKGKTVFTLTVTSDGKIITDFGGQVTVSLPYTLKDGEKPEDVTVWYLAQDGTMTEIPCTYDAKTKLATFTVSHFSEYVVGTAEWVNPFTDVKAGDWCYNAIKYANQKGLFSGITATTFEPNAPMTRAMLWTVLARHAGQDVSGGAVWYAKAQSWAVTKEITDGENPTGEITREQLITMLWRMSGSPMLADYPGLTTFKDAGDISRYAQQAMAWAHQKGLVEGNNNLLTPQQNATRAQVATIMQRYCEGIGK